MYSDIAQAYLETIDQYRRIAIRSDSLAEKKRWLARVGFEMQRHRTSQRHEAEALPRQSQEALAVGDEVRRWIAAAMSESLEQRSDEDAAEFVAISTYYANRNGRTPAVFERLQMHLPRSEKRSVGAIRTDKR